MIGMEFVENGNPRLPNKELCGKIVQGCADEGLIIINAGTFKNIIRILCPLVITDEQLIKGLDILESQIEKLIED